MLNWRDYVTVERLCYTGRDCYTGEIMLHWRDYVILERLC